VAPEDARGGKNKNDEDKDDKAGAGGAAKASLP